MDSSTSAPDLHLRNEDRTVPGVRTYTAANKNLGIC